MRGVIHYGPAPPSLAPSQATARPSKELNQFGQDGREVPVLIDYRLRSAGSPKSEFIEHEVKEDAV